MGMMDDLDNNMDFDDMGFEEEMPPEESGNRTFLIVAGILGGILLLSLIAIAGYAMMVYPDRQAQNQTQVAEINAQNTEIALSSQLTAEAKEWTATPTITATASPTHTATATALPITDTPVVAPADEGTQAAEETATQAALLTEEAAQDQATVTLQPTALPDTGFADDIGLPTLVVVAGVFVVLIVLSRRLRKSSG
jgi:hypothetical protein